MKCKNKGYTLLEALISFGIMIFITSLIMTFFKTNLNNFSKINNYTELQFQSQYILNFMSNKIMECSSVVDIRIGTERAINATRELPVTKISVRYGEQDYNCYIFEVRNNKIYYGNSYYNDSATVELGTYVSELIASPHPDGKKFAQADALKITIKLVKDNQVYEANQIIYMRSS